MKQNGYIAGFKGRKIELEAGSLLEAKQKAVAAFKPNKRDAGLVWVALAEKDGQPVVHVPGELP